MSGFTAYVAGKMGRNTSKDGAIELVIEHYDRAGETRTGEDKVAVLLSHVGLITFDHEQNAEDIRLLGTQHLSPFNRTTKIVNKPEKLPPNFISLEQPKGTLWCNMDNVVTMQTDK